MAVEIGKIQKLTSPNPFALVTTRKADGTANIMALSWWTYVSNKPPMIVIATAKKGYSGELITANGEFGLNLVGEDLAQAAMACGGCSGRERNKAEEFGIALEPAKTMETPLVKDAVVSMECRLVNVMEASDHRLFLAEITEASIKRPEGGQLYAVNGYGALKSLNLS